MTSNSSRRFLSVSFFESFSPSICTSFGRMTAAVFVIAGDGVAAGRGPVADQNTDHLIAYYAVVLDVVDRPLGKLAAESSEARIIVKIAGVPPALVSGVQRLRAWHLLDTDAVPVERGEYLEKHSGVACKLLNLVVGVEQAVGYENYLLPARVGISFAHMFISSHLRSLIIWPRRLQAP